MVGKSPGNVIAVYSLISPASGERSTRPPLRIGDQKNSPGASACCRGMAFEFSDSKKDELRTYLKDREGSYPVLRAIYLVGAGEVIGFVSIYAGKNVIRGKTLGERAKMAWKASGASGLCVGCVRGIAEKLCELGIDDPAVTDFWKAVSGNR